jgi:hypothetical protein
MTAIGITAISAPLGPGPGAYGLREVHEEAPRAIAGAPARSRTSVPRRTSHHAAYRPSALPAPHRTRARQQLGRVSAASRGAADRAPVGPGSAHPHRSPGSGGKPGGGPRGQPGGGSARTPGGGPRGQPGGGPRGGPAGGSNVGSGAGPAGGSTGPPGGVAGGEPAGGANGGVPGGQPASGPAGGSAAGSASGSGSGSAGGSSGASGGGSGGTGTGMPATKDQCKTGGYVQYGFPNQGQCVAFVERGAR